MTFQEGFRAWLNVGRGEFTHAAKWLPGLLLLPILVGLVGTPQPARAITVDLQPGLNLLAYPAPTDQPLDCGDLLAQLGGDTLDRLDPPSQQFQECVAQPFVIAPGEGYQLWMPAALALELANSDDCPRYDLKAGLNLIAIPQPIVGVGCYGLLEAIGDPT